MVGRREVVAAQPMVMGKEQRPKPVGFGRSENRTVFGGGAVGVPPLSSGGCICVEECVDLSKRPTHPRHSRLRMVTELGGAGSVPAGSAAAVCVV